MKNSVADYRRYIWQTVMLFLLSVLFLFSCQQGAVSEKPPIHINPNMDSQNRYDANALSGYFADGMVNRMPVKGTVAVLEGYEDTEYFFGKTKDGKFIKDAPLAFSYDVLTRGQERFEIYCAPCHSGVGDGKGIIINRGFLPPPTFHQDRIRKLPDGQIFDIISSGYRNMPSYKHQIPVLDRWAIVGYVRALQRSQNATVIDVPEEIRTKLTSK